MTTASPSPLIVALDYRSGEAAMELVRRVAGAPVAMFKVGSELFTAAGPQLVRNLAEQNFPVFLDLKFHDIPNTAAGATTAAARLGVALLDVHAAGGIAMMRAAKQAAREVSPGIRVIAVTVLTSLGREELTRAGVPVTPGEQVLRLAEMAAEAGLDGVVASASEAEELRRAFPRPFLLVVPGIRPAWASQAGDQKRLATPGAAVAAGADYIVVGRPVTQAPDPKDAVLRIIEEISKVTSDK